MSALIDLNIKMVRFLEEKRQEWHRMSDVELHAKAVMLQVEKDALDEFRAMRRQVDHARE